MWEATVRADESVRVAAEPASAWSLLSSPLAWSALPRGSMAFAVGDPVRPAGASVPDPGRLRFWLAAAGGRAYAELLEVTAETPGQTITLQTAGGRLCCDLSVQPGRRGAVLRIVARSAVGRPARIDAEAELRAEVRGWLSALREIADGGRPLPEGIPEPLRRVCLAQHPPGPVIEATASTVIGLPIERVRQLVGSAEVAGLIQLDNVVFRGRVPGTPGAGQVGAMQYSVWRGPDGGLACRVRLLAASSPSGLVARYVTAPFSEVTYRYEPAGASTRLEICSRRPGKPAADGVADRDRRAAEAAAAAGQIKTAIEGVAARNS